jgi:putative lipoic acid-binding regulatory protein
VSDQSSPAAAPGLEFPCAYPLKLIGRQSPEFPRQMMEILERRPGRVVAAPAERASRDGNFVSLAVTVQVESRAELDGLFRELHATGLVLFAL